MELTPRMRQHLHPRTVRRLAGVALALSPLLMGADRGCIANPPSDSIVTAAPQAISVQMRDDQGPIDGEVELLVDGQRYGVGQTVGSQHTFEGVSLSEGTHVLSGYTRRFVDGALVEGEIVKQQVHVRSDLVARGRQEVVFSFTPEAEQRMREIATGTLAGPLGQAELDSFVSGVKQRARALFEALYAPFNVVLVDQATPGGEGHVTVVFEDQDAHLFVLGTTIEAPSDDLWNLVAAIPDFNNRYKAQRARVFVGVFKQLWVDQGQLLSLPAVSVSDSLDTRIRDLGIALGSVAVHEVGHTLGLVAQDDLIAEIAENNGVPPRTARLIAALLGIPNPLPDLGGCYEGHNCPQEDLDNELSSRFGGGYHVMDPGELVPLHARIGLASPSERTEKLPRWSNYSASYLRILHPAP